MNDKARLLCAFWKRRADRAYLVNRCVSRVELTRQIIEADIATGLSDFSLLRGTHVVILSGAKNLGLNNNQGCFASLNMTASEKMGLFTTNPVVHFPVSALRNEPRHRLGAQVCRFARMLPPGASGKLPALV